MSGARPPLTRHRREADGIAGAPLAWAQDVVFAAEGLSASQDGPAWSLYCVADGHMGLAAANYVEANLWRVLAPMLPKARMPDCDSE
ncbi:unnamed protein product, partial [Ostreobium quekettii]